MPQTTPNNTTTQQAEGIQLFIYQIIKTRKATVQNCPLLPHALLYTFETRDNS